MALSTRPFLGSGSDALGTSQASDVDQLGAIGVGGRLAPGSDLRLGIDQTTSTGQLADSDVVRIGNGGHSGASVAQSTGIDDTAIANVSVQGSRPVELTVRGHISQDDTDRARSSVTASEGDVRGASQVQVAGDDRADVETRADAYVDVEMDDDGTIVAEVDFDIDNDGEIDMNLDADLARDGAAPVIRPGIEQDGNTRESSTIRTDMRGVEGVDVDVSLDQWGTIDQGAGIGVATGAGGIAVGASQSDAIDYGSILNITIDTH